MSYYVTNENSFLDIKNAHLRVTGNVHTDVLKVGSIGFQPAGSNIPGTVNFTNVITGVTTSSNLDVGGTLNLGTIELSASTHTLDHITARGNVTSTTVQFDNATTGLVTTANVEVGGELTVTGNVSDLNVVSNVNMLHTSNTASIKLNSNVVAEFPRSKKLIKYPRIILPRSAVGSTYNDYRIDRSSEHVIDSYLGVQDLFNNTATDGNDTWGAGWQGSSGSYSTSTGEHSTYVSGGTTQGTAARLASNVPDGEWVSLQLPNAIQLNHVKIRSRNSGNWYSQYPTDFEFWGSNNNGTTWSHIKSFSNKAAAALATFSTFQVDSTKVYSRIALVVTKIPGTASTVVVSTGQAHFSISELHLYGTPEYDPEAHGTDVVVKSVPNVPNTDWLEVYYDAKDLADGAVTSVTDLSPNTNNGTVSGDPQVSNGAFVFDGVGDYIQTGVISEMSGDKVVSYSVWIKADTLVNTMIVSLGQSGVYTTSQTGGIFMDSIGTLYNTVFGNGIQVSGAITTDTWIHIVATKIPGGSGTSTQTLYINGVKPSQSNWGTIGTPLSLSSPVIRLGASPSSNQYFNGSIANFRLFNRVLTSDEIYQLYAYQKEYFGLGDLSMTLKAGRLGIGTSEPRAALDVRGGIYANGSQSWPIPTAHFYKASPGTSSTAYHENLDTGRVDLDNTLRDAPGIIERVVLTSSAPVVTTNGTTGGVIKFCKPGNYHVSVGIGVAKQYTHSLGFDLVFIQVGTEGKLSIGKTNNSSYGGAVVDGDKIYPMGYRRTFLVNVSNAPTYGSIYVQPSSNNGNLFRFETYGATSLAHADVYYLG